MQIVTEEQIKKALEEAGIEIKENCFYELDDGGFGKVINLPRFRTRLQIHEIDGETKVSYICGINKINKKTKIPFTLDKDKSYLIIFITKNRFGRANHQQIIAEFDRGNGLCQSCILNMEQWGVLKVHRR